MIEQLKLYIEQSSATELQKMTILAMLIAITEDLEDSKWVS